MQHDISTAGMVDDSPRRKKGLTPMADDPKPVDKTVAPVAPVDPPHPMETLVERWWEDHFPGSAVARDTQSWNIAHAAKEKLKQLLRSK